MMPWWAGNSGPCWWYFGTGSADQDLWDHYLQHLDAMAQWPVENGHRVLLTIAYRQDALNSVQRRQIADVVSKFIENELQPKIMLAHAVVTDSKFARGAITAMNWMMSRRKPFDERAFDTVEKAVAWLAEKLPAIDTSKVLADIGAAVPSNLPWSAIR
jgi:hypothetical protein